MADLPIQPLFMDGDTIGGAQLRRPIKLFAFPGVVQPDDLRVVPHGGTAEDPDAGGGARNLSVDILAGEAVVWGTTSPGTQGAYLAYSASTIIEAITANASGSTRIDSVVLEIIDAGATHKGRTRVVAGTPGSGVPPTLPANALLLATVTVTSGDTVINGTDVADLRTRAVSPTQVANLTAVTTLAATAWTDILSITTVLARPCRVRFRAKAQFVNSGTGRPLVDLAFVDGTTLIDRRGEEHIGGTSDTNNETVSFSHQAEGDFAAGSHTFKLRGHKDTNGTITVTRNSVALDGYSDYVTRMWVEVVG